MLRFLRPRPTTRETGARAEDEALAQLLGAGLELITRNFLARGGELDLVMREGAILVFVEVRFRADDTYGDGLDSVGKSKQQRLVVAASAFLAKHPHYQRWAQRFDIVSLGAGGFRWERNVLSLDQGW